MAAPHAAQPARAGSAHPPMRAPRPGPRAWASGAAAPARGELLAWQASIDRQLAALAALDDAAAPAAARVPIRDALAFGAQVLRSIA